MAEFPDAWMPVLNVLLEAPKALQTPTEIAAALGLDDGETTDLLCELDLAGWLVVWDAPEGPFVTLSALAAERLGARLVEVGRGETPRWARAGDPDPPAPRSKYVCTSERAASLEFVADPALPPELRAEQSEYVAARVRALADDPPRPFRADDLPWPTRIVGLGLTPWPGPGARRPAVCPACGNGFLQPHMYCLYCDRWGLDRLTGGGTPARGPSRNPRPDLKNRPEPGRAALERLQAEKLRARRKAKRKERHQARLEAERRKKLKPSSS